MIDTLHMDPEDPNCCGVPGCTVHAIASVGGHPICNLHSYLLVHMTLAEIFDLPREENS